MPFFVLKTPHVLLFFACTLLNFSGYAQKTSRYEGALYFANTLYNDATYDYYLFRGDTIWQGPFRLQSTQQDSAHLSAFSIEGEFLRGRSNGKWTIKKGTFTPAKRGRLNQYAYELPVSGDEFVVEGRFDRTVKTGEWKMYDWVIKDAEVADTLFFANFSFQNNVAVNRFQFYSPYSEVAGKLDTKGFTDGIWSFYVRDSINKKNKLLKEWIFEDNQLTKKVFYENEQQVAELLFQQEDSMITPVVEEVEINENYFKIIDHIAIANNGKEAFLRLRNTQRHDVPLLLELIERHASVDALIESLAKSEKPFLLKTKIKKYPYTAEEKEILDVLDEKVNEIDTLLITIQRDPQINLIKISKEGVNRVLNSLESIRIHLLAPADTVIHLYEKGYLEYLNRGTVFQEIVTQTPKHLPATYLHKNDTIPYNYTLQYTQIDRSQPVLQQFSRYIANVEKEIALLKDSLDAYISEVKKAENLVMLEAVLVDKYETVKRRIADDLYEPHNNLAGFPLGETLVQFLDAEVGRYSESSKKEKEQVERLIDCITSVERMVALLVETPNEFLKIKELYTRQVFNPYTFTNMEERVRPSIYRAFEEIVLPACFQNLKTLTCENVGNCAQNFSNVFEGMVTVLKRDTKREERRIKRMDEAQRIADLLDMTLYFTN